MFPRDVDWYAVPVQAGKSYDFGAEAVIQLEFDLVDAGGKVLAAAKPAGSDSSVERFGITGFKAKQTGIVFLRMRQDDDYWSAYKISVAAH